MKRGKIEQIGAIFYMIVYMLAMLTPRRLPAHSNSLTHTSFLRRILHEILYYGGPLEPVVNFFLLIPIFIFLVFRLGRSKALLSLAICIALSAASELLQSVIPGRVSSLQDFALNSLGALSALLIYRISSDKKVSILHED
jgi:glycopeptide antibiotics resistance protein